MLEFLRKLFRGPVQPYKPPYLNGLFQLAMERGKEKLPCCGKMRREHAKRRSGSLQCPLPTPKLPFRYNPLEVDEDFNPPWSEPHFLCTACGCARGLHRWKDNWKRGECTDPLCRGCPGGCA